MTENKIIEGEYDIPAWLATLICLYVLIAVFAFPLVFLTSEVLRKAHWICTSKLDGECIHYSKISA